ncbi:MAG: amidohydrolase family protein [Lentisphaerae bacterium]|nr:amidohydrolase family protein [Lentisphaerota bacterium]
MFDINGHFGESALDREFPLHRDLLAHMDRLGIRRALTWHAAARQFHAPHGNRLLLETLAASPAAARRLVPAFTIAPVMMDEPGALDALGRVVASGRVRALRIFPAALRHRLSQIESVVDSLLPHKPMLILDMREIPDEQDILTLAERFADRPLICTQAMWPRLLGLFDLMRRRANLCLDTSWLHTYGTIEQVVGEFGAERLLFGLGPRTHQGAAIAALAHADIGDRERDLIAHGNLERLLDLPASRAAAAAPRRGRSQTNSFWPRLLQRRPLNADIVDAHAHLGPCGFWPMNVSDLSQQIRAMLRQMDRLGIALTLVSGTEALFGEPVAGHRALARALRPHADRIKGYVSFNPYYERELTPHLDAWFAQPFFTGFKLLCDYWNVVPTDPRFEPVWKTANARRLPILLHTWDSAFSSPALLTDIVTRYPRAVFLLGHSGGGDRGRREAEQLAIEHPNVYLEWCGSFCSSVPWEDTLRRVGAGRVVFGTDTILHSAVWELGRLLSLELPDKTLRLILGGTMRKILDFRF